MGSPRTSVLVPPLNQCLGLVAQSPTSSFATAISLVFLWQGIGGAPISSPLSMACYRLRIFSTREPGHSGVLRDPLKGVAGGVRRNVRYEELSR